jgi:hypothetical protein
MYYVTRISHQMQKHKFGVTCLDVPFLELVPVPRDEDINTSATIIPSVEILGPIT